MCTWWCLNALTACTDSCACWEFMVQADGSLFKLIWHVNVLAHAQVHMGSFSLVRAFWVAWVLSKMRPEIKLMIWQKQSHHVPIWQIQSTFSLFSLNFWYSLGISSFLSVFFSPILDATIFFAPLSFAASRGSVIQYLPCIEDFLYVSVNPTPTFQWALECFVIGRREEASLPDNLAQVHYLVFAVAVTHYCTPRKVYLPQIPFCFLCQLLGSDVLTEDLSIWDMLQVSFLYLRWASGEAKAQGVD